MGGEYSGSGDPARSMQLLWGLQERPKRGPKPRFSVEEITRAAIVVADAEGLEAVTMRRVGDQLGVTAMSLYSYIPGKAELLDLMLDTVVGETLPAGETALTDGTREQAGTVPNGQAGNGGEAGNDGRAGHGGKAGDDGEAAGGWRARLERVARDNWALYLRHPWLLQVATTRPVLGPNVLARYDHELRAIDGAGLSDVDMDLVISMLGNYVHGAVRAAVDAAQAERRTGMSDQQWWEANAPLLEQVFDAARYPVASRVGAAAGEAYQAPGDPVRCFEFGLQRLLDGVAAYIRSATA